MKIWFVEIGEPLPLEENVRPHRYGNFCTYLAKQGHQVTWWTSSFSHMPKKHIVSDSQNIHVKGFDLRILYGGGYDKNVSFARIRHNKNFAQKFYGEAKKAIQENDRPNIIVAPIPTIENAMACLKLATEFGIPLIADIRDEWPDELVRLLPSPLRIFGRIALLKSYGEMAQYCQHVKGIMGVSQRQLNYGLSFAERPQTKNDLVFPLGYPNIEVDSDKLEVARKKFQDNFQPSRFVLNACFFGTLGRYFEFDSLAEAARKLPDVGFVVAGEGDKRKELTEQLEDLPNVYLPGWVNVPDIAAIAESCHVGLGPYKGSDAFAMPNKIYEYLSYGLAVGCTIEGEFKDYVDEYNFGFHFKAGDGENLASHLKYLKNNPDDLLGMQKNASKLFNEKFSHDIVFKEVEAYLQKFTVI